MEMGLGTPNRKRMRRKRERERMRPMVKKWEKMKSLSKVRLRPFLGTLDLEEVVVLGFEVEGRIDDDGDCDDPHDVPRREEKAMFGLGKTRFWSFCLWGSLIEGLG